MMSPAPLPEDKTLLIVEDDRPFRERLARAMEARGFQVAIAETVAQGIARTREAPPAHAVVDLKLDDGSGLDVVEALHAVRPDARALEFAVSATLRAAIAVVSLAPLTTAPRSTTGPPLMLTWKFWVAVAATKPVPVMLV